MRISRVLPVLAIGLLSACTRFGTPTDIGSEETRVPVSTEPEPQSAAAVPVPRSTPSEIEAVRPPSSARVLVLRSSDGRSLREVDSAVTDTLGGRYRLARLSMAEMQIPGTLEALRHSGVDAAIAIGSEAAEFVARELEVPTVFCQVFDSEALLESSPALYGVEALPPLALQLESWLELAPGGDSIGIVLSADHQSILEAAREAAREAGVRVHVELATSDLEALYLFKRIAHSVDGFWLFPDGDILSPSTLREMLAYALEHGVQSIVFNDSLLEWGGLLSVDSRPDDVAAALGRVLDALTDASALLPPRMTPLTAVDVTVNGEVATVFGLEHLTGMVVRRPSLGR